MTQHEGPVLVHCAEGKDRTGFVCATIMSLAGAHAQDIIADYMKTYDCYYQITETSAPKKYEAILDNIHDFLYSMCEKEPTTPLEDLDLQTSAIQYLKQGGLNSEEVSQILNYIQNNT